MVCKTGTVNAKILFYSVALLIRFLIQNNGIISKRARDKEFVALNDEEVNDIQNHFQGIFMDN